MFERQCPLFDAIVPCLILQNGHEDRNEKLVIRILEGMNNNGRSVLRIEVTDDPQDAFFLHFLSVSEETFGSLRQEQTLLVDFKTFPIHLMELLHCCLQDTISSYESTPSNTPTSSRPKNQNPQSYTAVLNLQQDKSIFSIVETNRFKQLTHISLQLEPGNEKTIPEYLAQRLALAIEEKTKSQKEANVSKNEIVALEKELVVWKEEIVQLKNGREHEIARIQLQHEQVLATQKECNLTNMETSQKDVRMEYQNLQSKHNTELMKLKESMDHLEKENQRLEKENMITDNQNKTFKKEIIEMKDQNEIITREVKKVKETNETFDSTLFNQNKEINKYHLKIAVLEQQASDKEDILNKTSSLLKLAETHKKEIEESLQLYKKNHASLQSKLEQSVQEINKGNHIIEKIHGENQEYKSKTKVKSKIIKSQESSINAFQKKYNEMTNQYNTLSTEYHTAQNTITILETKMESANKKIDESSKLLTSNQKVISWLNKEVSSGKMPTSAFAASYTKPVFGTSTLPPSSNTLGL